MTGPRWTRRAHELATIAGLLAAAAVVSGLFVLVSASHPVRVLGLTIAAVFGLLLGSLVLAGIAALLVDVAAPWIRRYLERRARQRELLDRLEAGELAAAFDLIHGEAARPTPEFRVQTLRDGAWVRADDRALSTRPDVLGAQIRDQLAELRSRQQRAGGDS